METNMTAQQSLELIQRMIGEAKRSFHRMSFYFLLWGVVLILATFAQFLLAQFSFAHAWIAWPVACTIGGLLSGIRGAREGARQGADSIMDRVMLWLWLSFNITLVVVIICAMLTDHHPGPWVTVLTGLPTFATGMITRFKPLMLGGVLFWVIGVCSFFTTGATGALLFVLAMVFGYLVPGYLLKRQEDGLRTA